MAMTADQLPDDPDALKAMVLARDVENARLTQIIKELQRHRFGRRAESLPEDQLLLGLEEAEQIEAAGEEAKEQVASEERNAKAAKRRANRGALPPHLPRKADGPDQADLLGRHRGLPLRKAPGGRRVPLAESA